MFFMLWVNEVISLLKQLGWELLARQGRVIVDFEKDVKGNE